VKIPQKFTITLLKAQLIFGVLSTFVERPPPHLNNSRYSCPVKVALPPPQPLPHSFLQHLVTGIMLSSQAFFPKDQTV